LSSLKQFYWRRLNSIQNVNDAIINNSVGQK